MSFLGGLFGGGTKNHTTTQTSQYPPEVQELQRLLTGGVQTGMTPYIENPEVYISPRTDYQDWMRSEAHQLFDGMSGRDYGGQAHDMFGRTSDIGPDYAGYAMGTYGAGHAAMPVAAHVPQLGYADVAEFANPFAEDMTNTALRRIDEDHNKRSADIAARAATRGAFGGSGEAISHFLNDQQTGERVDDAVTQIAYDSYGQGLNAAMGNLNQEAAAADRFINTVFNSAQNDQNAASLADGLSTSVFNRGRGSFQDDLSALQTAEGLDQGYLNRMMAGIADVNSQEASYRTDDQQMGDRDWTAFSRMAGFVPGYMPNTTSTQPVYSNPMGNALGALTLSKGLGLWG